MVHFRSATCCLVLAAGVSASALDEHNGRSLPPMAVLAGDWDQHGDDLDGELHNDRLVDAPTNVRADQNKEEGDQKIGDVLHPDDYYYKGPDADRIDHSNEQHSKGADYRVDSQPRAAQSMLGHTTTKKHAPVGAAGEFALFLSGAIFGAILVFLIVQWNRMDLGFLEDEMASDAPLELPLAGKKLSPVGNHEAPAKSSESAVQRNKSRQKKDRGVGDKTLTSLPLDLPLAENKLAPVGNYEVPSLPTVSQKHESWQRKDRGVGDKTMTTPLPLDLPLAGNDLASVRNFEVPARSSTSGVQKHESWQKKDSGFTDKEMVSNVPLELPLDGTEILAPIANNEVPPGSSSLVVQNHERWVRDEERVSTDRLNLSLAGSSLAPVGTYNDKGVPSLSDSFTIT